MKKNYYDIMIKEMIKSSAKKKRNAQGKMDGPTRTKNKTGG